MRLTGIAFIKVDEDETVVQYYHNPYLTLMLAASLMKTALKLRKPLVGRIQYYPSSTSAAPTPKAKKRVMRNEAEKGEWV